MVAGDESSDRSNECSICLEEYTDATKAILPCCHQFHKECIREWMYKFHDFFPCPMCCHAIYYQRMRRKRIIKKVSRLRRLFCCGTDVTTDEEYCPLLDPVRNEDELSN